MARTKGLVTGTAMGLLAACVALPAVAQTAATGPNPDPWEHTNRGLYSFGRGLDAAIIRPPSIFFKRAIPRPGREGVHNVLANLGEPVTFFNDVLQVRLSKAGTTLVRFGLNSTVGVVGIFDVASGAGAPRHISNFGQTMGRYGVPQGPYVYIPVLGPSSVRGITGRVVDGFSDPFNYLNYGDSRTAVLTSRAVISGLSARGEADATLREVDRTATDPYTTLRSAYLQNADSAAHDGAVDVNALPDFGPEKPAAAVPAPVPPKP